MTDQDEDRRHEQQVRTFDSLVDAVNAVLEQYGKHDLGCFSAAAHKDVSRVGDCGGSRCAGPLRRLVRHGSLHTAARND